MHLSPRPETLMHWLGAASPPAGPGVGLANGKLGQEGREEGGVLAPAPSKSLLLSRQLPPLRDPALLPVLFSLIIASGKGGQATLGSFQRKNEGLQEA